MMRTASLLALVFVLVAAPAVPAADTGRVTFSGIIVFIDPAGGVLRLEEVGPWRVGQGRTVTTVRTVLFNARTRFNTHIRVNAPGGFPGDFIEVDLDIDSVTPGDFATVECVRDGGRLVAVRVTLAESHPTGNVRTP